MENLLKSIFQLSSLRIVNWVTVPPVIINFLSSFYCGVTCCIFAMKDKSLREIVLKAMGQAISKSVAIAEIIKVGADPHFHNCVLRVFWVAVAHPLTIITFPFEQKNFPRLHQDTAISSVSVTDVWEPIEEGLVPWVIA